MEKIRSVLRSRLALLAGFLGSLGAISCQQEGRVEDALEPNNPPRDLDYRSKVDTLKKREYTPIERQKRMSDRWAEFTGIIADTLKVDPRRIHADASFQEDLDADEDDMAQLAASLEEKYSIRISDADARNASTVKAAFKHVHVRTREGRPADAISSSSRHQEVPDKLFYTQEHQWLRISGDSAVIGMSHFGQYEIGDIVYVELPDIAEAPKAVERGDQLITIEAVKTVSEILSPLTGVVVEVNDKLHDSPEAVNNDPYGKGWMTRMVITDASETRRLITANAYRNTVNKESGNR